MKPCHLLAALTFVLTGCASAPAQMPQPEEEWTQTTQQTGVLPGGTGAVAGRMRQHGPAVKAAPVKVTLAANGKALLPIVISPDASAKVKETAAQLQHYLGEITGAPFRIETGNGESGIVVGTRADFPATLAAQSLSTPDNSRREEYVLLSGAQSLFIIGATDVAVSDGVWDLLYRLGYRLFFPSEKWEIVPKTPDLQIAVNVREQPDYISRRIWFTYSTWPENLKEMETWNARNRVLEGLQINTGHAYEAIIQQHKAEFDAHPEYLSHVDGKPTNKLNIANPELRSLVVNHVLQFFEKNPNADSFSLDPSDGGGWGESAEELKIGSPSDRAVFLANEVAAAVQKKFPGKFIGMYAYNQHSAPPTIRVHPNVAVNVATTFITGGYSVEELTEGWQKQGATIGMREYYSVVAWNRDMPRNGSGADLKYLQASIPRFYNNGARFMSAESSDNWGPMGLGYYIASRILWNIDEAGRIDELKADFLDKSFGEAHTPMAQFYDLLKPNPLLPMSDSHVGRMYRALDAARKATNDAGVLARINDLVLYTRYVELYRQYSDAKGEARQAAFEDVLKFSYRIRSTHMVHSLGLYRDLHLRDRSVALPVEVQWNVPEDKNPLKSSEPFGEAEYSSFVANGIASNKVIEITPVVFGKELVPATPLRLPAVETGNFGPMFRGANHIYTWAKPGQSALSFMAKAGLIYTNLGDTEFYLYDAPLAVSPPVVPSKTPAISEAKIAPDRAETPVELKLGTPGLKRLLIWDGTAGTSLQVPEGAAFTMESSPLSTPTMQPRWTLYFYVPKGTPFVGGFGGGSGTLNDANGRAVYIFGKDDFFNVPVGPGQDGNLWSFRATTGTRQLITVPPYLARNGEELLLPREVIEADAP